MWCEKITFGMAIKSTSNLIKRYFAQRAQVVGETELTGTQMAILMYMDSRKRESAYDVYQKDIEKAFDVRSSTATNILQTLERRGFIRREGVPGDLRLKRLLLTEKADDIAQQHEAITKELDSILLHGISDEDMKAFYRVVDHATKNIRQHLDAKDEGRHANTAISHDTVKR